MQAPKLRCLILSKHLGEELLSSPQERQWGGIILPKTLFIGVPPG